MNDFEKTLTKLNEEAGELQKKELSLRQEQGLFNEKLAGFLKENGLSDNFTVPELAMLAIRKCRQVITL